MRHQVSHRVLKANSSCCPLRPRTTPFPDENPHKRGNIWSLLWAGMNPATPPGDAGALCNVPSAILFYNYVTLPTLYPLLPTLSLPFPYPLHTHFRPFANPLPTLCPRGWLLFRPPFAFISGCRLAGNSLDRSQCPCPTCTPS